METKSGARATVNKASHTLERNAAEPGTVLLRGVTVALNSDVGDAFTIDCARHTEGLLSEADIKSKWALTDADWVALADNTALLDLVRRERERRIFSGAAAAEGAQHHFARAPNVLGGILNDGTVSPRHRIEAARELRQAAVGGDKADALEKEKFVVVINLGASEKPFRYEAEIEPRKVTFSDNDGGEP